MIHKGTGGWGDGRMGSSGPHHLLLLDVVDAEVRGGGGDEELEVVEEEEAAVRLIGLMRELPPPPQTKGVSPERQQGGLFGLYLQFPSRYVLGAGA